MFKQNVEQLFLMIFRHILPHIHPEKHDYFRTNESYIGWTITIEGNLNVKLNHYLLANLQRFQFHLLPTMIPSIQEWISQVIWSIYDGYLLDFVMKP